MFGQGVLLEINLGAIGSLLCSLQKIKVHFIVVRDGVT